MRATVLTVVTLLAPLCVADGKFVTGPGIAATEQPYQRAIVQFRDGRETLIVESFVRSEEPKLAWLLPVPGPVDSVEAVSPGTVETLGEVVRPDWFKNMPATASVLLALALVVVAVSLTSVRRWSKMRSPAFSAVTDVTIACLATGLAVHLVFPVFAKAGHVSSLAKSESVGSFEVTALDKSVTLEELQTRGIHLSQTSMQVLDGHMRDGWTVLLFELGSNTTGYMAPHPVKVRFKSQSPIYPMALTMSDGGKLDLDLYVVADGWATNPSLQVLQTVEPQPVPTRLQTSSFQTPEVRWTPTSHPQVSNLFWPGCKLTRMRATSLSNLRQDIKLELSEFRPNNRSLLPREDQAAVWLVFCAASIALATLFAAIEGANLERERPQYSIAGVSLAILVSLTGSLMLLGAFDIEATQSSESRSKTLSRVSRSKSVALALADYKDLVPWEVHKSRVLADLESNGTVVVEKDVPGGFWVEDRGDLYRVSYFDMKGCPYWIDVSKDPAP